jgi:hypothetical protein
VVTLAEGVTGTIDALNFNDVGEIRMVPKCTIYNLAL